MAQANAKKRIKKNGVCKKTLVLSAQLEAENEVQVSHQKIVKIRL